MFSGFKKFIMRGNVVDLAVGVVMGSAFGNVVSSLTKDLITPVIGFVAGTPDFSGFKLGPILIGNFINAIVAFLLVSIAIYFFIIIPMNALTSRLPKDETPAATKACKECLSDIPIKATRCAHCTQVQ